MVSIRKYKSVSEIVSCKVTHPSNFVSLLLNRKPDGDIYFTCSSPPFVANRQIHMSSEELMLIFDHVEGWIDEGFKSGSIINEWGFVISGGKAEDTKRTTLLFSNHNNIEAVDVRVWGRNSKEGVFSPSCYGITIQGKENIITFTNMREEVQKRIEEAKKLDEFISLAHKILYKIYNEHCVKLLDYKLPPIMSVVNVEEFRYMWNENKKYRKSNNEEIELAVSPRDIYTYVTTTGLDNLKTYCKLS